MWNPFYSCPSTHRCYGAKFVCDDVSGRTGSNNPDSNITKQDRWTACESYLQWSCTTVENSSRLAALRKMKHLHLVVLRIVAYSRNMLWSSEETIFKCVGLLKLECSY